jgi:NAD+ synthetase
MSVKREILELSRQSALGLSPWFDRRLDEQIERGVFLPEPELERAADKLMQELVDYRTQAGVGTAVLGMSGGVDSALTAALLKRAGWRVVGFTLPIMQDPIETERGVEACQALGLEHEHVDLSDQYRAMVEGLGTLDAEIVGGDDPPHRIRRGNMRARLRMITLYDQAHRHGGLVASTDNFSELAAGFWTLHGDVGDLAPVQSLLKSWEVPWMARHSGVPERTWRAKPTDGLGISSGDEAQIGATYLEFDILVMEMIAALHRRPGLNLDALEDELGFGADEHARGAFSGALHRLRTTWYKRVNPITLDHPTVDRFVPLDALDARLFRPAVLRADEALSRFGGDLPDLAHQLVEALKQNDLRLVTAESCTAGLLAACVAEAPGSSAVLEGSITTYCSAMKTDVLGVSADLLDQQTPYCADVAKSMAAGALDRVPGASLALSITGVAGPGPDQDKPAGLVFIGCARRGGEPQAEEHTFEGRPSDVLAAAVAAALRLGLKVARGD